MLIISCSFVVDGASAEGLVTDVYESISAKRLVRQIRRGVARLYGAPLFS
jgi:hypothetical protein